MPNKMFKKLFCIKESGWDENGMKHCKSGHPFMHHRIKKRINSVQIITFTNKAMD